MKLFADTNWLIASLTEQGNRTAVVERFVRQHGQPWTICPPVLAEARCVLARELKQPNSAPWQKLLASLGTTIRLETSWDDLEKEARVLTDRYSHKEGVGTFDLFVLAGARLAGASHFLCFDSGSNLRAIASLEKLRVFPPATAFDKERAARFR